MEGRIVEIDEGDYMARVTLNIGDNLLTTVMPLEKFRNTGYKLGDQAAVAFKALNVKMML
jgi:molybdopterin-binding protein